MSGGARRAFKTSYKPVLQLADQSIDALLLGTALGKLDRLVDQLVDAPLDECAIETFWHNLPMCVHPPRKSGPSRGVWEGPKAEVSTANREKSWLALITQIRIKCRSNVVLRCSQRG